MNFAEEWETCLSSNTSAAGNSSAPASTSGLRTRRKLRNRFSKPSTPTTHPLFDWIGCERTVRKYGIVEWRDRRNTTLHYSPDSRSHTARCASVYPGKATSGRDCALRLAVQSVSGLKKGEQVKQTVGNVHEILCFE